MNEGKTTLEEQALLFSQSLETSLKAYEGLLDLEREQTRLIENSDFEGAAAKIDQKNSLLGDIKKIDRDLQERHQGWQSVRDQAPDNLRERLQGQVEALQGAMSRLLEQQRINEDSLKRHGEEIGQKLKEINRGKAARQGYRQKAAGEAYQQSKFYDKKH